jgi:hypothetical protein
MHPQLVSKAATALCDQSIEKKQVTQIVSAMKKFGSHLSDFITVPIKITRTHYAKMMFQKFHPPKKFHAAMSVFSGSVSSQKAFDVGCRLTCGLEIAYQLSASEYTPPGGTCNLEGYFTVIQKQYMDDLNLLGIVEEVAGKMHSVPDFVRSSIFGNSCSVDDECFSCIPISKPSCAIIDCILQSELFINPDFLFPSDSCESDDWLYFPPEEFDAEMMRRAGTIPSCDLGKPPVVSKPETVDGDVYVMDEIVDRMKKFVDLSSDFEGVDNFSEPDSVRLGSSSEVNFDTDKFLEILRNEVRELSFGHSEAEGGNCNSTVNQFWSVDSDDDVESLGSAVSVESDIDVEIDEATWPESSGVSGVGTFEYKDDGVFAEQRSSISELRDSDDEGDCVHEVPSSFMSEYVVSLIEKAIKLF